MSNESTPYGKVKRHKIESESEQVLEEISILGFAILEGILSQSELEQSRTKLDAIYRKQENEFGKRRMQETNELNLVRCPLAYDPFFLELAAHRKILTIVEALIGEYILLHLQNGILNAPGEEHNQSFWHRDLPYQDFVISHPLAVSALFCIDDFTQDRGGTWVLPYSHKMELLPSDRFLQKHQHSVAATAGSVILFDGMLYHRAGLNSSNEVRRGINHVYVAPILKQQIDLPVLLQGRYAEDPFYRKFLGYDSQVPGSDQEYRQKRYDKLNAKR